MVGVVKGQTLQIGGGARHLVFEANFFGHRDAAIAVHIKGQQPVLAADPASAFSRAIAVKVEERLGVAVADEFDAVAVQIEHHGIEEGRKTVGHHDDPFGYIVHRFAQLLGQLANCRIVALIGHGRALGTGLRGDLRADGSVHGLATLVALASVDGVVGRSCGQLVKVEQCGARSQRVIGVMCRPGNERVAIDEHRGRGRFRLPGGQLGPRINGHHQFGLAALAVFNDEQGRVCGRAV